MIEEQTQISDEYPDAEKSRIDEIKTNIKAGLDWLKTGNSTESGSREKRWKRNKAMLRCDWKNAELEQTEFHVNIPFANFHTIRPNLIYNNPHVNVVAKKPEFVRDEMTGEKMMDENNRPQIKSSNYVAARLMETKLNHEIEQIDLKSVVRRCVGHSDGYYGIGWAKIGYQESSVSKFNNDRDNSKNYWLDWVDPRDVVYDRWAVEQKKMRWVAQRFVFPKQEVLDQGFRLPEKYTSKLPEYLDEKLNDGSASKKDCMQQEVVEFWEYHDLVQKTIDWVLLDGPGEEWFFMRETSVDPFPFEGSQFKALVLTEDDDDICGITSIQPVEEQVIALNRLRTREVHHMDNYGTGMFYEDGFFDPKERESYRKTPYGFEVKLKAGGLNRVKIQGTPALGADHYNMSEVHRDDIRTTLGLTDYQQGGSNVQRKATEAQIIRSDATIRIEDKRQIVASFIIEIVRALAAMMQEFDTEQDYYNVENEEFDDDFIETIKTEYGFNPKVPFLGIGRDQIQGEFDYSFNVEEMVMQPKEVRAAQLARSLSAVASNEFLMKKFAEEYDFGAVITEMFELNGVDVKKFAKGGPVQLTAVMENEMFRKGMEVPEPHAKDDDDEHVITHSPLRRELEQSKSQIEQKIMKLQSGLQMLPEMMAGDPQQAQVVSQQATQQIDALNQQLEFIEAMLRNVKLHMQAHMQQNMRKQGDAAMLGGGGGQPGQPAQGVPQQARPAQPPIGGAVL